MSRTQDEVVARIEAAEADDVFGWQREVLLSALDFEHAKPYLQVEVTAKSWEWLASESIEDEAREYLTFAIDKIEGHRGISAERSVTKLAEYAWLLGRDDVVAAMEAADYAQYGAPQVKAFADGFGWLWPSDPELDRMAAGLPCRDGCEAECGE